MRQSNIGRPAALILAALSLALAGCDLHDKAWDTDREAAGQSAAGAASGGAAAAADGDIRVTVASGGVITCRVAGAPISALGPDAAPPSGVHVLIVENAAKDQEERFAVASDLQSRSVSSEGRVTVRHLAGSLIVETEGAAKVTLFPRSVQDDVDDCVQFAGDDEVGRLAARIEADSSLVDGRDSKTGKTPLARAAELGRGAAVALLLDRKANAGIEDNEGFTPLHLAARSGRLEVVRLLVKAGADVNAAAKDGETAMSLAKAGGHPEIAAFLAGAGAAGETGAPARTPVAAHRSRPVDSGVFELIGGKQYGPFADGSEIRFRGGQLDVLRGGQSDRSDWEQFDLPTTRNAWIALQGTDFRVQVRRKGKTRVWAAYKPPEHAAAQ
ncbi:MAG TPA: ankyrin repeat domain-containing protein [Chthonomonadaceae bacterium]|nr:ankyrin repeat domain-containing protein [Chthonomonadaceae bacterium]